MLCTLALLSATAPLAIDMYLPGLPQIGADLGTSASMAQLTLTSFMIGLAVGQLAIGPLSDGLGRRRILLIGTAVLAIAGLACALSPSITVLIAARFLQGFSGGAGVVVARAVISDRAKGDHAAKLFSLMMIIGGLAPVIAPLIGGVLLGPIGWRGIFVVLSALALVMLVGVWRFIPETLQPEHRHATTLAGFRSNLATVLRHRQYLGYTTSFALSFGALFAYISASPFVIQDMLGFSPGWFSVFFAINAMGLTGGNAVNSRLIGRFRPRQLLTVGLAAMLTVAVAMTVVALAGVDAAWPILALMFALATSIGFIFGNATALALGHVRHLAGSGSAVLGALQFTVGAVVSPIAGLGGSTSIVPMALTILVVAAGANILMHTLTRDPLKS
ncbi:multidrug effflux MFS transporter [Tomitella biformata]|uniref:multidrug effflux MFS transporter n=1 Tax=Tomitella biformata TaxID=630403 RepID=UPI000465768F|nr:multidrug effflux MFS transporter [Tomitella biformata]